jgi:hypothetical protein
LSKLIIAIGMLGGLGGAMLASQRAGWPSAEFWSKRGWLVIAAICVAALVPPLQAAISEFGERGRRKSAELATTLHQILAGILIMLVEDAGADWQKTGIQVFRVRGGLWWKKQVPAARLRLAHFQPSRIKWTRGKGIIGKCWETGEPQSMNLEEHFRPHANIDELGWKILPSTIERYGLSFTEFQKTKGRFGLVSVFPLTKGDKYLGCITADMPPECSEGVDASAVRRTLSGAAPSIAAVIEVNK